MINGDNKLSIFELFLYFIQCMIAHRKNSNYDLKLLHPKLSIKNLENKSGSPSRILCNAFWNSIDYKSLSKQLNAKLDILDLGCGSGKYGNFIKKLSKSDFGSYIGLDIYKHKKFPSNFIHIKSKAENADNFIDARKNFIISQSALEHIEFDFQVINKITEKLLKNKKPFMQIHLVPAAASLWLYLWHGWRQYSKNNLSSLAEKLIDNFPINIFAIPIGKRNTFWAHMKNITIPYYTKKKVRKFGWYSQNGVTEEIFKSVIMDLDCDSNRLNSFWAFIISSKQINLNFKT